ncbi:hypothetical protein DFP72DRAFT_1046719 [Ephemerocybe angulata]|uniref:Uncharacterized protein n=1 Tax=Ephemerocybe angulata TaxID=980116 RepID=A0A8H6HUS9_9AGAR|nr:hypothetical protein DFP72DRAFT_1046719 [Tulosesus angulatus]
MTILSSFVTKPPIIRGYALVVAVDIERLADAASVGHIDRSLSSEFERVVQGVHARWLSQRRACPDGVSGMRGAASWLQAGGQPHSLRGVQKVDYSWRREQGQNLPGGRNQGKLGANLYISESPLSRKRADSRIRPTIIECMSPSESPLHSRFPTTEAGPTSSVDLELSQPLVPSELSEQPWWLTYLLRVVWEMPVTSWNAHIATPGDEIVAGTLPRSCLPQPPPPSAMQGIYAAKEKWTSELRRRHVRPETSLMTLAIPPTYTQQARIQPSCKDILSNAEGVQKEMMKAAIEAANRGLRLFPSSARVEEGVPSFHTHGVEHLLILVSPPCSPPPPLSTSTSLHRLHGKEIEPTLRHIVRAGET